MNPSARLSIALLLGLVLWFPTLSASMKGDIDLTVAAGRYLVAFLFARLAVAGVARLLDSYSSVAPTGEERTDADGPRRRADDAQAAELS